MHVAVPSIIFASYFVADMTRCVTLIRRTLSFWDWRAITRYGVARGQTLPAIEMGRTIHAKVCPVNGFTPRISRRPVSFDSVRHAFENLFEAAAENKRVCLADTRRYPNGPDESRQSYVLT